MGAAAAAMADATIDAPGGSAITGGCGGADAAAAAEAAVAEDGSSLTAELSSSSSPVQAGSSVWLSVLRSLWNFQAFWMSEAQ